MSSVSGRAASPDGLWLDAGSGRLSRRWAWLLAMLSGVAVLALVGSVVVQPAPVTSRSAEASASGLARLESLPLVAQSVISTSLGAGAPAFRARTVPGGYRLRGGGVAATVTGHGVVLQAGPESLLLRSLAAGRGSHLEPVSMASISGRGNRVAYRGGTVREWYAAGPLGIEQGFTVGRRPSGVGSALTLALGLGGTLRARQVGPGIQFVTSSGRLALRYGGLSASDAAGRQLPATLVARDGRLLLSVADRHARYPLQIDPLIQVSPKLAPGDELGTGYFGYTVALSADGHTALIGGWGDHGNIGAAWVYTGSGSSWSEQAKLVPPTSGPGAETPPQSGPIQSLFGQAVALSANGNTALIGGPGDAGDLGAAWVYTRSGSAWSEQSKLTAATTGTGAESGNGYFGNSVALSSDGTIAMVGAPYDANNIGAAWVFTGAGASWTQQAKLTAATTGAGAEIDAAKFGYSVALSGAGATALIGGFQDDGTTNPNFAGAAWVFTGSGSAWTQQTKLVGDCTSNCANEGTGANGDAWFGWSVALSTDGTTALIGAPLDSGAPDVDLSGTGAAWVFTTDGSAWTQQSELLAPQDVGSTLVDDPEAGAGNFGSAVALSSDGSVALIGASANGSTAGKAWVYGRDGSAWSQHAALIPAFTGPDAETGNGYFGTSEALSSDGTTLLTGAEGDNNFAGAAWAWVPPDGIAFTPDAPTFGVDASGEEIPAGTTVEKQLIVTNTGEVPRKLGTLSLAGTQASSFSLSADTCSGQTLTASSDCTVQVNFSPGAAGIFSAQVDVPDNALSSPDTATLTGFASAAPGGTTTTTTATTTTTTTTTGAPPPILTPPGTGIISGHVYDGTRAPIATATIQAYRIGPSPGEAGAYATSEPDGSYFLADLKPGVWVVTVSTITGAGADSEVTVVAGAPATQDFVLTAPVPLSGGITINGVGNRVPAFYRSLPVTMGLPFPIPTTGRPNSTIMYTGFGGFDEANQSRALANIQYQAAMIIGNARYGSDGKLSGISEPVVAPVDCSYSAAQNQACAQAAGIVDPGAGAGVGAAADRARQAEVPFPSNAGQETTIGCPVDLNTATNTTSSRTSDAPTLTIKPNALGGIDVTFSYANGREPETFVLAQGQIPSLSSEYPLTNIGITVVNGVINVSPAGFWNASVGSANALSTAVGQTGGGSIKSLGSAAWQITTQLIGTKIPEGELLLGTVYNVVTGLVTDKALSPTQPTTITNTAQTITCGNAYADPSGAVRSTRGVPLGGATVTLRRTSSKTVTPRPVPGGSIIMSAANRRNPDRTNALGDYGWDVLPGFYDVTATHSGCAAASGGGRTAVSSLLPVPPAQTGVNLSLRCPHLRRSTIALRLTVHRPAHRYSVFELTATLIRRAHRPRPQGTIVFYAGRRLIGALSLLTNTRTPAVALPLPATARVASSITAVYSGDAAYGGAKARGRL